MISFHISRSLSWTAWTYFQIPYTRFGDFLQGQVRRRPVPGPGFHQSFLPFSIPFCFVSSSQNVAVAVGGGAAVVREQEKVVQLLPVP